jgi:outer membrane receptor protein involved in Fe transport
MAEELPLEQPRKHRCGRSRPPVAARLAAVCLAAMAGTSRAAEPAPGGGAATLTVYDEIKVSGRDADLLGVADSASEGVTGRRELALRPLLRAGEVLETVPGVVITQHSGGGKANQYFLRGFNLDHGTDFRITVDDIPVNMPSHGHGQGYSDLSFLIPELIDTVRYKKGLYYADEGDFSAAGAATITYVDTLDRGLVQLAPGGGGYRRALVADSVKVAGGELLGGLEYLHEDGPWKRPDDYQKGNGIVRFHAGDAANGLTFTAMGYDGRWRSSDQIPLRAVREGLLGRFGELDPSDGGGSQRFSLAAEVRSGGAAALTTFSAYALDYSLRLFSNFTYFLEDPVHGDQFEQVDERQVYGGKLDRQWAMRLLGKEAEAAVGLQGRFDDIHNGLFHTENRVVLSATRQDGIRQLTAGPYAQARVRWTPWLRTIAGVRADYLYCKVDSSLPVNSGLRNNSIVSPKLSLLFGPWRASELYLNLGEGFHSNDARGATIRVDPRTGEPARPVPPLVRAKSADVGVRTTLIPRLQTAVTFFQLDLASELVFSGDAGTTLAGRPSRRRGVELQSSYRPLAWLSIDADYAVSRARFADFGPVGRHIPGAIGTALSAGVSVADAGNLFGSVRLRYFGPRPLVEDGSVRSRATSLVNLEAGYAFPRDLRLTLEVFNLLDARASDIDYFYASRLRGEPAPVNDIHFHPAEPRSLRLVAGWRF